MEKIKLRNEIEYPANDFIRFEDGLEFTVCGIADYPTFRGTLTPSNLEVIEVYTEGGVLSTEFIGYTEITRLEITEVDDSMDIKVYLKKEAALLKRIAVLEREVAELKTARNQ